MEFVKGDDLSRPIARGALPLSDALAIAKQIAEALEAAHGQGIVHRDRPSGASCTRCSPRGGRSAGTTLSLTLASMLKEDVSWQAQPADVPAPARRLQFRELRDL
jgi:hypothetical protein